VCPTYKGEGTYGWGETCLEALSTVRVLWAANWTHDPDLIVVERLPSDSIHAEVLSKFDFETWERTRERVVLHDTEE
jgi:uncharacterized protein YcaQ